jgi:hypothetical protein
MNLFWINKLKILVQKDLDLKNVLNEKNLTIDFYPRELESLHIKNAKILEKLIEKNGFPVLSNAGEEGVRLSWIIIQHSISLSDFMRSCLDQMRLAAAQNDYPLELLAYTEDLIAYLEGRGQIYGTHMEWREGELCPSRIEDPQYVDLRRKSLGLSKLDEQVKNLFLERPPRDEEKWKTNFKHWAKRVGWQSGEG